MIKRVCCLYRVSTAKQLDSTELKQPDIPMQRKACGEFADKMGWSIVQEEQENGVSGFKLSATQRDKIQLIKECAEQGAFDILLVFMFDRLGRRADETPFVVEWFVKHGIQVWSVSEGEQRFDSHTDYLLNYIRYWQASGESKKTSIRTKTALSQMVLEGRFRGGQTPYGYCLEKSGEINKHKREVNKIIINDYEADVVRLMFELCTDYGYGRSRIASEFMQRGIKNRKGENWHESTVGAMLHNVLYTGVLRSGSSFSQHFENLRVVKQSIFEQAQRIISERSSESKSTRTFPLNTTGQSLLSGNIFCGHCGGRLVLTTNVKTSYLSDGTQIKTTRIRYICYNKTRHRKACDGQSGYTTHKIDALVSTEMLHIFNQITDSNNWDTIMANTASELKQLQHECDIARVEYSDESQIYENFRLPTKQQPATKNKTDELLAYELMLEKYENMLTAKAHNDKLEKLMQSKKIDLEQLIFFQEDIKIWFKIFDMCSKERQKMIVARTILRVDVFKGYQFKIIYQNEIQNIINYITD